MSVLTLFLVLACIGLLAWVIVTLIPMPQQIKTVIIVAAVICAILYCLSAFGLHVANPTVPKI